MKFEESVSWGLDMGSEHERYLSENVSHHHVYFCVRCTIFECEKFVVLYRYIKSRSLLRITLKS